MAGMFSISETAEHFTHKTTRHTELCENKKTSNKCPLFFAQFCVNSTEALDVHLHNSMHRPAAT